MAGNIGGKVVDRAFNDSGVIDEDSVVLDEEAL